MRDIDYAFAVATIRSREPYLLTYSFMEQLIDAPDYAAAKRILSDKGLNEFEKTDDVSEALSDYIPDTWSFLKEIAPDKNAIDFLVVKNDFHNLKAVIKGIISGNFSDKVLIKPCIIDTNEMYESVKNKSFDSLPKWISDTAAYAYELLTSTMDGQLFDMMIDKASLAKMIEFSKKSNSNFAIAITDTFVSLTNIKIALRLSESNKSDSVYDYAFCECDGIDVNLLKKASQKGKDEVVSYIEGTNYAKFSEYINKSYALFEKKCDNAILEMADSAKLISFGIEPLVAYYFAKEAECKTLKIIMNGKHIGLSKDEINERVRELYV